MDGCFWHGCPEHFTQPNTNAEYWRAKIDRNRTKDAETNSLLKDAGWLPVRVWEHEDVATAAERIRDSVQAQLPGNSRRRESTPRLGVRG